MEVSAKGKQERPSLPPDNDDSEQEEEEYLGTKMGPKATLPSFLHKVSIPAEKHSLPARHKMPFALRGYAEQQPDGATMSGYSACLGKQLACT